MSSERGRPGDERASGQEVNRGISNAVVHLYREHLGRGPERTRTTVRGDAVLILIEDGLTRPERLLVANGHGEDVMRMRRAVQAALRAEIIGVVEEHTGRPVTAFMSDQHVEPDVACEVLVLGP